MANNIKSKNIKVFPNSKRSHSIDPYALNLSEQNITLLVNSFTNNKSYIISQSIEDNVFSGEYNIGGYLIKIINGVNLTDLINANENATKIYLSLNVSKDLIDAINPTRLIGYDSMYVDSPYKSSVNQEIYTGLEILVTNNITALTSNPNLLILEKVNNEFITADSSLIIDNKILAVDDGEI